MTAFKRLRHARQPGLPYTTLLDATVRQLLVGVVRRSGAFRSLKPLWPPR